MYGSILQYLQVRDAAINAAVDPTDLTAQEEGAVVTAISALAGTNEFAAAVAGAVANGDTRVSVDAAAGFIISPEMSAAATAYATKAKVCHMIQLPAALGGGNINTCLPDAGSHLTGANLAAAHDPAATLIYSPVAITGPGADGIIGGANAADDVVIANTTANGGALLPSIGITPDATALQTTGLCTLWGIFTDATIEAAVTSPYVEAANTDGIQVGANETCYGTADTTAGLISTGFEQSLKGNEMPFSDLTVSMGIAYTFQTNNLEVTPRLDYYYRSESNQSVFNIEQNKVPAWDEINFRLNIVPTNGDWRVVFYGQNLTDERNITATAITNSSTSHTNTTFVREPRSFGFQFGIDF